MTTWYSPHRPRLSNTVWTGGMDAPDYTGGSLERECSWEFLGTRLFVCFVFGKEEGRKYSV